MNFLKAFAKILYYGIAKEEIEEEGRKWARLAARSEPVPEKHKEKQFRIVWLRRLLIVWWVLSCLTIGVFFLFDLLVLGQGVSLPASPEIGSPSFWGSDNGLLMLRRYAGSLGGVNLAYDLWAFAALWFMARAWKERLAGYFLLKPWGLLVAVALVFGRGVAAFSKWSLLFALIPDIGWLFPIKYVLLPPVTLAFFGLAAMLTAYLALVAAVAAFFWLPLNLMQSTLKIKQQLDMVKFLSVPFFGAGMEWWLWFTGRRMPEEDAVPDDSKGARFAIPREIAAAQDPNNGTVFGQVDGQPLRLPNEKHVLIMASTRSGKGVALIIPHLLRYQGSAFVLDPKGENARATARQRRQLNQKVRVLDPFGISGLPKARFNPLSRFTPENSEAESKALAAALVLGERDHWTASAQQLLAAFILFVVTAETIPKNQKDLKTVRMLLLSAVRPTLKTMQESRTADGLLSMLATSFLETPEKEFGSILSTAQRETEILDNPHIAACLAASGDGEEVDFAAWHSGTMTVYLCLSAPKFPVFSRWLRLVLTSALDEMTDQLKPPPLPVCFMLDELAALGHLEAVENAVGLAAGYGITLWNVFQDIAQIKDLYQGRWPSFIGNAGVRAVFNLDDLDSADYWSRFIGQHLVETRNTSQNAMGYVTGASQGETLRPLLSPDDMMRQFAADKMLVLAQGSHPMIADRLAYFDDPRLEGLWDDPRQNPAQKANSMAGLFDAQGKKIS